MMPAASISLTAPDEDLIELITTLSDTPKPDWLPSPGALHQRNNNLIGHEAPVGKTASTPHLLLWRWLPPQSAICGGTQRQITSSQGNKCLSTLFSTCEGANGQ